jgi:5-methylcytosine-specific restriction endonuclease McrA
LTAKTERSDFRKGMELGADDFVTKPFSGTELLNAVEASQSMAEVVRRLGLNKSSTTYATLKKDFAHHNIQPQFKKRSRNTIPYTFEEMFCENSTCDRSTLRNRIIKEEIFKYECSECGIIDWNTKPLTMQLDHIDGNPHNHKLDNLRMICPNCHGQTETWCGKNK